MLSFLIASVIALLSGMGVGGGGLLVLWLSLVLSWETRQAQGLNLLFFCVSASASLPVHLARRSPDKKRALLLTLSAVPGVFAGCALASRLPTGVIGKCFGIFLLVTGGVSVIRFFTEKEDHLHQKNCRK